MRYLGLHIALDDLYRTTNNELRQTACASRKKYVLRVRSSTVGQDSQSITVHTEQDGVHTAAGQERVRETAEESLPLKHQKSSRTVQKENPRPRKIK